ncbi:MAG: peptide chain release factor N(5)-glutamine methyltransferase [Bdellovibrionales bacterium]|nr:peptide chain release factor N(5)-glutamine methyltransferase [Bdellovibrionales bacterium]
MKISELKRDISSELKNFSTTASLDAEVIIAYVLNFSRLELVANSKEEVTPKNMKIIDSLVKRRILGEPIAYLTGKKEFFGIDFKVNSSVLVPRPETEIIISQAIKIIKSYNRKIKILDLGTGSACIPIALAVELDKLKIEYEITAVDTSEKALEIAKENALNHCVKINFIKSDWFSAINDCYDIITANPPYIAENDLRVSREINFEPRSALYAGNTGMDDIYKILDNFRTYLAADGFLLMEIGFEQAEEIKSYLIDTQIEVFKDLSGLDRMVKISCFNTNNLC